MPAEGWSPACDADGHPRDGAWVADVTGLMNLTSWPDRMRVIVRKERPHPRCTATDHRRRRAPHHRVRDQHRPRATRRSRATPSAAGPLRGPDPQLEGHRPNQPSATRFRTESDLVRHRCPRRRAHRLDADARPHQARGAPVGTQTPTATAAVQPRRPPRTPRPCPAVAPVRTLALGAVTGLDDRHPAGDPRTRLRTTPPVPTNTQTHIRPVETGAHPERHGPDRHTRKAESPTASGDAVTT
jgi:hypothetical protein